MSLKAKLLALTSVPWQHEIKLTRVTKKTRGKKLKFCYQVTYGLESKNFDTLHEATKDMEACIAHALQCNDDT